MAEFEITTESGETILVNADKEEDLVGLDFENLFAEEEKQPTKPHHAVFDADLSSEPTALSNVGDTFRNFMVSMEGSTSKAKDDGAGFLSIGVGHKLTSDEKESGKITIGDETVDYKKGLSEEQINTLFEQDMTPFAEAATDMIEKGGLGHVPNIHSALSSLMFNVGIEGFKRSDSAKALLRGDLETFKFEAFDEKQGFVNAGGKPVLVGRRRAELELLNPNRGIERAIMGPVGGLGTPHAESFQSNENPKSALAPLLKSVAKLGEGAAKAGEDIVEGVGKVSNDMAKGLSKAIKFAETGELTKAVKENRVDRGLLELASFFEFLFAPSIEDDNKDEGPDTLA